MGLSFLLPSFSNGIAFEFDLVRVVQEAITDGIGQSGITHSEVPVVQGILAGDDGGTLVVAIFDDLHEVLLFEISQGSEEEVVDDQDVDLSQAGKGFEMGAIAAGLVQGGKESGGSEVKDGIARAGGEVAEGTGDKAFTDTSGAAEKDGAVILDPLGGGEV